MRSALLAVSVAIALAAAGCASKQDPAASASGEDEKGAGQAIESASTSANTTQAETNATTATNSTRPANATKPADMPSKPENCMRGMDMDGCTAAQADAYFDARKANAPPPDKELPPVVITLDAQGSNPTGSFTLDAGTMTVLIEYYLNSTGPGPYFALGADGAGDLALNLVGPTETKTITIAGLNAGADPAKPLAFRSTSTLDMPTIGDWTVTLEGQGANVELEVRLVERFYM